MRADSPKTSEKYVTVKVFEKHMAAIARSFQAMDEKMDAGFAKIMKILDMISEDNRAHKLNIIQLNSSAIQHERSIDNLQDRVGKVEKIIKIR